jgi:hypothetical protein
LNATDIFLFFVRKALVGLGPLLVAHGLACSGDSCIAGTPTVDMVVGAGMTFAGIFASWWRESGQALVLQQFRDLRAKVGAIHQPLPAASAEAHAAVADAKAAAAEPVGKPSVPLAPAACLALGLLLLPPPGHAAEGRGVSRAEVVRPAPVPPQKPVMEIIRAGGKVSRSRAIADPIGVLQGILAGQVLPDVTAAKADADAQTPVDQIGSMCWGAIINLINSNPSLNPFPDGFGAAQLVQKARDLAAFTSQINSPTGPLQPLKIGCAPMIIDTQAEIAQLAAGGAGFIAALGAMLGVVIP